MQFSVLQMESWAHHSHQQDVWNEWTQNDDDHVLACRLGIILSNVVIVVIINIIFLSVNHKKDGDYMLLVDGDDMKLAYKTEVKW